MCGIVHSQLWKRLCQNSQWLSIKGRHSIGPLGQLKIVTLWTWIGIEKFGQNCYTWSEFYCLYCKRKFREVISGFREVICQGGGQVWWLCRSGGSEKLVWCGSLVEEVMSQLGIRSDWLTHKGRYSIELLGQLKGKRSGIDFLKTRCGVGDEVWCRREPTTRRPAFYHKSHHHHHHHY